MKLFSWTLFPHRFDRALRWPWQESQNPPEPTGSLVLSVVLLSLLSAAVLVLTA
jgi:hypothetical protein